MHTFPNDYEHERSEIKVVRPPIELLLDERVFKDSWPQSITENQKIREQVESRRLLIDQLNQIFAALPRPDVSLAEALAGGSITEQQILDVYESLSRLITDPEYRRAVLYVPFELLPTPGLVQRAPALKTASEKFSAAYMQAWNSLLVTQDVRANFVDGDVLDVESRTSDLPRVVKAAHLIPELVKHDMFSVQEAERLFDDAEDPVLRQSLVEALWILADLKLLSETGAAKLEAYDRAHPVKERVEPANITDKRRLWLKQEEYRKTVEAEASRIAVVLTGRGMTDAEKARYSDRKAPANHQEALILGIQIAIESCIKNPAAGAAIYDQHREILHALYLHGARNVRERATVALRRLTSLGIVPATDLDALKIPTPALAGPFSENLKHAPAEIDELQQMTALIEQDPVLSRLIYPAIVVFGSRLKGYGSEFADIDIAVFVKPGTDRAEQSEITTALQAVFNHEKIHGEIVEFWLDEKDGNFAVHNDDRPAASSGESHWTHVLFGGAWMGDASAITKLREKLLVPYFYETNEKLHGLPARRLYIEELERDTLQYRLMHKGYARFFPPVSEMAAPHRDRIDGASAFYDSGYRQTALRLYAHRVFLPKI